MKKLSIVLLLTCVLGTGCCRTVCEDPCEQQLTLGVVQREIREGMDQGDVAVAMGSPNIVTKDKDGKETWIYDKISSETQIERRSSGICLILVGANRSSAYASTSQKTLTVVVKFDNDSKVQSVSYNASRF